MRIIGIDPGYDRLGIAILDGTVHSHELIFSTCIETDKKLPLSKRLQTIGNELEKAIKKYSPERLGVETLFFNTNQKTALAVAEARGIILYVAEQGGLATFEYSPQAIKIAVTGHGGSAKEQVEAMLHKLIVGIKKDALDDEYDAIAVALTCLVSERV